MKVLLAFLHFGPYHIARLAAMREASFSTCVTVQGIEMASSQGEYNWADTAKDDILCVSKDLPLEQVPNTRWSTLLKGTLDRVDPNVCAIAGYSHPAMLALIALCMNRGIPWILMSDSQEIDEVRQPWLEWVKSRVVRLASAGLVAGTPHLDYLAKLGLPVSECRLGYDVVDNRYFAEKTAEYRISESTKRPYFLASARFLPKKNLFRLLSAYALYVTSNEARKTTNEKGNTATKSLCLLGDGELKADLFAHSASLSLKVVEAAPGTCSGTENEPVVFIPGFRQIDELPRFYANAAAFVHASTTEQWGLVVNEAMACGLPVLVSNRCGCAPDLVVEGKNGWTFDPFDIEALAALLVKVTLMPENERSTFGEASQQIIANWGTERFASGLISAATRAIEIGPKRVSWPDLLLLFAMARR